MKNVLIILAALSATVIGGVAYAEPRTEAAAITKMRPYTSGGYFVTVGTSTMTDSSTCTNTYTVQEGQAGSKAVIASLLTAYALGQEIQIEIPTGSSGTCAFGHPIQSVFLAQ